MLWLMRKLETSLSWEKTIWTSKIYRGMDTNSSKWIQTPILGLRKKQRRYTRCSRNKCVSLDQKKPSSEGEDSNIQQISCRYKTRKSRMQMKTKTKLLRRVTDKKTRMIIISAVIVVNTHKGVCRKSITTSKQSCDDTPKTWMSKKAIRNYIK